MRAPVPLIQYLHQRFSILLHTGRENHQFIALSQNFQKFQSSRPYQNIHMINTSIYFYWQHNIRIFWRFKRRMNESFIQIQDQGLPSLFFWILWWKEYLHLFLGLLNFTLLTIQINEIIILPCFLCLSLTLLILLCWHWLDLGVSLNLSD